MYFVPSRITHGAEPSPGSATPKALRNRSASSGAPLEFTCSERKEAPAPQISGQGQIESASRIVGRDVDVTGGSSPLEAERASADRENERHLRVAS